MRSRVSCSSKFGERYTNTWFWEPEPALQAPLQLTVHNQRTVGGKVMKNLAAAGRAVSEPCMHRLLTIPNNNISGPLPESWGGGGWLRLQIATLYGNNLTGSIPSSWTTSGTFPAMMSINNGMCDPAPLSAFPPPSDRQGCCSAPCEEIGVQAGKQPGRALNQWRARCSTDADRFKCSLCLVSD